MDVLYTLEGEDQVQVLEAKSVGFNLSKNVVHVWNWEGVKTDLFEYDTEFVLAVPEDEGGEEDE